MSWLTSKMIILSLEAAKNSPHLPIKDFHTLIRLNIVVFIAFLMKMTIVTFILFTMDIVTWETSIQKLQFRVHQEPIPCIYSKVRFKVPDMMRTSKAPYNIFMVNTFEMPCKYLGTECLEATGTSDFENGIKI